MKKTNLSIALAALLLAAVGTILPGCRPQRKELAFETIARAEGPGTGGEYQGEDPKMVIITRGEEIDILGDSISFSAQDELRNLDFNEYFGIAVFQGLKGTNMYGVDIQRVTKSGNTLTIFAHFTERNPELAAADVNTSPFHIVKVPKNGLQGEFHFFLNVDGDIIIDDLNQKTPIPTPTPMTPPDILKALEHIAAREGIPVENLIVVNQYRREYPMLGRAFWAVTALENNKDGEWYRVMIDLADGSFVDDIEAVEQAEEQAGQAKYGKLEPALYERLKNMQPEETVPVAVWIAGAPGRSEEELYAALADKYPEAKEALERSGKPFDVADHELMMQIKAEYLKMLNEDTQVQVEPLVSFLQAGGYSVTAFDAMPAISATLPKSLILEIALRSDVGAIYLTEEKEKLEPDTAVPSHHVPSMSQSGFKGNAEISMKKQY